MQTRCDDMKVKVRYKAPSLHFYFALPCMLVCNRCRDWALYITFILYHPYLVCMLFGMPLIVLSTY